MAANEENNNDDNLNSDGSELEYPVAENWCNTQFKVEKSSYAWIINNFSFCRDLKMLTSSTFVVGKTKWCLKAYPKGYNTESRDYLSLYLAIIQCPNKEAQAKYELSVLDANGDEKNSCESLQVRPFVPDKEDGDFSQWGFSKFIKRDLLKEEEGFVLPGDKLTILCRISLLEETINHTGESGATAVSIPEASLSDNLANLLDKTSFSDVTLCVGDMQFQAHKAILGARSPVFCAMFNHNLEENQKNRVKIPDVKKDVFREMLRFVYTGKIASNNLCHMAQDLLVAADKYALERLKILCEAVLCTNLCVESVSEMFVFADLHTARQLKEHCKDYIVSHAASVMVTQGWRTLVNDHIHLVSDSLQQLANEQHPPLGPPTKRFKPSVD